MTCNSSLRGREFHTSAGVGGNPGLDRGGRSIVQRSPACPRSGRSGAVGWHNKGGM
jgi:hypothetical protein